MKKMFIEKRERERSQQKKKKRTIDIDEANKNWKKAHTE